MNKYMFTAKWCGQCSVMKSIVKEIADVQIIDIEENPEYVEKYSIMGLPTYVVDDGEVRMENGIKPKELIKKFYEKC